MFVKSFDWTTLYFGLDHSNTALTHYIGQIEIPWEMLHKDSIKSVLLFSLKKLLVPKNVVRINGGLSLINCACLEKQSFALLCGKVPFYW